MKLDPTNDYAASPPGSDTWLKDLLNKLRSDDRDRGSWSRRTAHYIRRRLCKEFRDDAWPWQNASTIVIPTMAWTIDRLKPPLIQSVFGVSPVVTIRARNPESVNNTDNVENLLDWMMETGIPDAEERLAYGADDKHQYGFAIFKVWYDHQVEWTRTVLHRSQLPPAIAAMTQMAIDESDADKVFQSTRVPLLSKAEMVTLKPELTAAIQYHFGLDPEDDDDSKTIDEILAWIRSGKPTTTVRMKQVVRSIPVFMAVKPEHFIIAPSCTGIQTARRMAHRIYLNEEQVYAMSRSQKWIREATDIMLEAGPQGRDSFSRVGLENTIEMAKEQAYDGARRTYGSGDYNEELYEVWEIYTYANLGHGPEKVVVTVDPRNESILRFVTLPFAHGKFPFVQIRNEHIDERFYRSRSTCELIDDLDVEITRNHRDAINARTITAAPVFLYRQSSMVNPEDFHFVPGEMYPVQTMDDVRPLLVPPKEQSYLQEESILFSYLEKFTGILDSSLTDQGRLTRPRTAFEVSSVGNLQGQIAGSSLLMWHKGLAKVYHMLHALWIQFGPDELFIRVNGPGAGDGNEFRRLTKHEIMGQFDYVPTPAALNNPFTRTQEAQAQLQLLLQVASMPQFLGIRYRMDGGAAVESFLSSIDSRRSKAILHKLSDQEVAQVMQQMQQAQAAQQATPQTQQLPSGVAVTQEPAEGPGGLESMGAPIGGAM